MGLIAIIFGVWLMQERSLQEKQVLLLTGHDRDLERQVEQQLRELTLNIKYQDVADFQRHSAPKGIALVITPYATPLTVYSPLLIHAECRWENTSGTLGHFRSQEQCKHQQQRHHPEHLALQMLEQHAEHHRHQGDTAAHRQRQVHRLQADHFAPFPHRDKAHYR